MKPRIKAKWVSALRSGKYKQTTGIMYDQGAHCCLGVLCEVAGAKRRGGRFIHKRTNGIYLLPEALRKQVALDGQQESHLTRLNDHGKTFDQIADYIEKNL